MSSARRSYLIGLTLVLLGGAALGWLYGRPMLGLLLSALAVVGWQVRQLFALERAMRTGEDAGLRFGNGIWPQMYSRFGYERRRAQKHKRRYRRLLKEVRNSTNALPDGAIILNDGFEIIVCNTAAEALAGLKPRQDRGQRVDNIIRDPAFSAYLRSGDFERGVEIRSPLREGEWLNLRLVPYGGEQHLLLIRDVTERMRISKMRREFVANASHELRSPLTVISGYLDALVSDADTPAAWAKPISDMRAQAERMKAIVDELLELSRLEASGRSVEDERIDVCRLLDRASQPYRDREDGPRLEVRCASRAALRGSPSEIESVVSNLLSNAVRHTPSSGTVTLDWEVGEDGGALTVSDTGEGIDEEDIPRVTERFFRVNRGRSRQAGGVGLGLAIVKHALQRHDATLSIESRIGEGSRFTCRFPRERIMAAELLEMRRTSGSS